jgi:transcriptional regulator with XRE-family HTH domain
MGWKVRFSDVTLGEKISILRRQRGWTQDELAERVQVHTVQVSRWETGKMRPSRKTLQKIAEVLGVTADELRSGEQPLPQELSRDRELVERVQQIRELDPEDRAMILRMIDTLLTQKRLARLLVSQKTGTAG